MLGGGLCHACLGKGQSHKHSFCVGGHILVPIGTLKLSRFGSNDCWGECWGVKAMDDTDRCMNVGGKVSAMVDTDSCMNVGHQSYGWHWQMHECWGGGGSVLWLTLTVAWLLGGQCYGWHWQMYECWRGGINAMADDTDSCMDVGGSMLWLTLTDACMLGGSMLWLTLTYTWMLGLTVTDAWMLGVVNTDR